MHRRLIPAVFFLTAVVILLIERSPTSLALVALGTLALFLGYFRRGSLLPYVAGLLLYIPLAVAASAAAGPLEGCLVAGSLLVLGSERMSFENDLSRVLEARTGVDFEASLQAEALSSAHLRKLEVLAGLIAVVAVVSLPLAGLTFYASVVMSCSVILILAVYSYVRWLR